MKSVHTTVVSAALAAMAVTGAEAADYGFPGYLIEQPAVPQFGGFYLGVVGGYTFGRAEFSSPLVPGFVLKDDLDGWDGGIVAGYDLQSGSYFTGIELLGALGGPQETHVFGPFSFDYGIDAHVDARIRAGFLASDALALYAIGGATYARTFAKLSAIGFGTLEDEEWRAGWLAGAGGEFLLTPSFSIGAEYTYTSLGSKTHFGLVTSDGYFNAVRAAARYRF
jgi:outer membrane immunogenic protein